MSKFLTFTGRLLGFSDTPTTKYAAAGRWAVVPTAVASLALVALGHTIATKAWADTVYIPPPVIYRTRDQATINWTDRSTSLTISNANLTAGTYGTPNDDGIYTITGLSLRSTVVGTPAVLVTATLPIKFTYCNFFGWGRDASLKTGMVYVSAKTDTRFEECLFISGKPPAGNAGACPAHGVKGENASNCELVNCEQWGTRGFDFQGWTQNGATGGVPYGGFRAIRCASFNIDGRIVDANGNWMPGDTEKTDYFLACWFRAWSCPNLNNTYTIDCLCRQDPVYGARQEDFISTFGSYPLITGGVAYKILHTRNLSENSLAYDPNFTGVEATYTNTLKEVNGMTMGLIGDNGADNANGGLTELNVMQYSEWRDSTFLTAINGAAAIESGHHNIIRNCTTYHVGAIRSANPLGYTRLVRLSSTGVSEEKGTCGSIFNLYSSTHFHDNGTVDCKGGYFFCRSDGSLSNNVNYFLANGSTSTNYTSLPKPASVLAGLDQLDAYRAAHFDMWDNMGIRVGLSNTQLTVRQIKLSVDL